jgi:hypothetical protein
MSNRKGDFGIIFQKIDEYKRTEESKISNRVLTDSAEINKLREIVLEINEENDRYFSTT